ncbi:integrin alpha-X-like [Pholidichthys leucotaenia]
MMDWIIPATLVWLVLNSALCFNIDPVAWKTLQNSAAGFGYKVVQRQSDVLVSAPLKQYSDSETGQIFQCSITPRSTCHSMTVQVPDFAVNMSLGLMMTSDPRTHNTLVCGPTIPKDCKIITMHKGVCFQISHSNRFESPVPSSIEACPSSVDIAFLLDGSGSVYYRDFTKMKNFVKNMIQSFLSVDSQFSVSQYSTYPEVHYYFDNFFKSGEWKDNINNIKQKYGSTFTATAIRHVVENVFIPKKGSRPDVKKILIVITDGRSNYPHLLSYAAKLAERKNIVRFSIGVGRAFAYSSAKQELITIASSPSKDYVFKVQDFDALEKIRQRVQDKIFSIEGSQTSGESLTMEMSQEGFSGAYVDGGIQMAVVGANQWRGGYMTYTRFGQKVKSHEPLSLEPDSYLGYSMSIAHTLYGTLTIVGAPRYKHRGIVMAVDKNNQEQRIDPFPWEFQAGEYFGAEVSVMNVDSDVYTDLVLISAPMYKDNDREGRVYVCMLTKLSVECHFDDPLVLRGDASENGRFGSSLAVLPDLNADGLRDLAVGAPLENDNQGSIYIFHGEGGQSISPTYSQRIAASEVQSGLKFFGLSISQSSFDQSGDKLTDLAVGSRGKVILLRSRPVVMVEADVSFTPNLIPTQNVNCSKPLEGSAQICFKMKRKSVVDAAQARIDFTLTLDATRKPPNNRAYVSDKKQREMMNATTITFGTPQCFSETFFIQACPEDALNVLSNELKFSFEGLPLVTNLRPSLSQKAQTTKFYPLGFEINCGSDEKCVDGLNVDFNFTRSSEVKVGIDELLDVTVSVENSGENSYNSLVILTYPAGISYRKFTILQGRIECKSLDSEDGLTPGRTDCTIDKPIFKSGTKVFFIVSYGIETNSQLDKSIFVTANATSGNQERSNSSELFKMRHIDVKYSIFVTTESSLSYSNFTFGQDGLQKPVQQSIKVTNNIRALNFTVVIEVPVKLGDEDIWVDLGNLEIADCQSVADVEPQIKDFVTSIQKNKVVDCSVALCRVFRCSRFMGRLETKTYQISANLSSGWIEQIGLESAKFLLTSTASLDFDKNQYIFFSTESNNNPPVHKTVTEVEVYPEPDFTTAIVGGSLGGLALLALLTAGLYKAGFFKSKYQDMINKSAEEQAGPAGDASAPPVE